MFEILTVYHGGTEEIKLPKVNVGRPKLDFGPGFYVTDIYAQAKDWSKAIGERRNSVPVVNVYHLRQREIVTNCRSKIFTEYNCEWLDFITQSRLGNTPWDSYDYIEGGVADDRVVNTVRLYMSGFISMEDALQRLQYFKPANQICILNQNLLDRYLTFVKSETIDHDE